MIRTAEPIGDYLSKSVLLTFNSAALAASSFQQTIYVNEFQPDVLIVREVIYKDSNAANTPGIYTVNSDLVGNKKMFSFPALNATTNIQVMHPKSVFDMRTSTPGVNGHYIFRIQDSSGAVASLQLEMSVLLEFRKYLPPNEVVN